MEPDILICGKCKIALITFFKWKIFDNGSPVCFSCAVKSRSLIRDGNVDMKIVELNKPNLKNVPQSMRRLAELIEGEDEPNSKHAVVISVDDENDIHVYEYGETNTRDHVIGLLFRTITKLSNDLEDKENML